MSPKNRAAWITAKQSPINVVDNAPYTNPSANELVIKTKAIALNPADFHIQKLGILLKEYPAILGCDVAGEVVEVHSTLANVYHIGDRVFGAAACLQRKDGAYCYSAFQEYVVLKLPFIARIPKAVAYKDAVVFPLGMNTAASCLFSKDTLELSAPFIDGKNTGQGKCLVIWGASSSVGTCGVQLAIHAGYEVVGVASKRNHEMVKGLGASICFDQSDPVLVDDIVKYLNGKDVVGAFAAIVTDSNLNDICEILDKNNGRRLVASVMPGSEDKGTAGVKVATNFTTDMTSSGIGKATWKWLDESMEANTIQYMPQSEVVGKGLEQVQQAVDLLGKGVSAKKLVVLI